MTENNKEKMKVQENIFYARAGLKKKAVKFAKVKDGENYVTLNWLEYAITEEGELYQKVVPVLSSCGGSLSLPKSQYKIEGNIIKYEDESENISEFRRYNGRAIKVSCNPKDYFKIGDIFYSTWGVRNYTVNFWQIIRITPKSIKFARIESEIVAKEGDTNQRCPAKNKFVVMTDVEKKRCNKDRDCKAELTLRFSSYYDVADMFFGSGRLTLKRYIGESISQCDTPYWYN